MSSFSMGGDTAAGVDALRDLLRRVEAGEVALVAMNLEVENEMQDFRSIDGRMMQQVLRGQTIKYDIEVRLMNEREKLVPAPPLPPRRNGVPRIPFTRPQTIEPGTRIVDPEYDKLTTYDALGDLERMTKMTNESFERETRVANELERRLRKIRGAKTPKKSDTPAAPLGVPVRKIDL